MRQRRLRHHCAGPPAGGNAALERHIPPQRSAVSPPHLERSWPDPAYEYDDCLTLHAFLASGRTTPFVYAGPATYVEHRSELPMQITWRLLHRLPGDVFADYRAAVE